VRKDPYSAEERQHFFHGERFRQAIKLGKVAEHRKAFVQVVVYLRQLSHVPTENPPVALLPAESLTRQASGEVRQIGQTHIFALAPVFRNGG
jgi:hypothetical protein